MISMTDRQPFSFICSVKTSWLWNEEKNYHDYVGENTGVYIFCFVCMHFCKIIGSKKAVIKYFCHLWHSCHLLSLLSLFRVSWMVLRKVHCSAVSFSSKTTFEVHKKCHVCGITVCVRGKLIQKHTCETTIHFQEVWMQFFKRSYRKNI